MRLSYAGIHARVSAVTPPNTGAADCHPQIGLLATLASAYQADEADDFSA
jgi:hypothetical protein